PPAAAGPPPPPSGVRDRGRARPRRHPGRCAVTGLQGHCDPAFAPVRDELAAALGSGAETGVSLAVIVDGAAVVDLWGGTADPATGQPWAEEIGRASCRERGEVSRGTG